MNKSGITNQNPSDISLPQLLVEDLKTYNNNILEPGFLAVAVHRFGNWRMGVKRPFRAPLTALYRTAQTTVNWMFGIDLPYDTKLGRRVRLWHHGGMVLTAKAIGNDVHIRQGVTFGLLKRNTEGKPTISDGVDIACGVAVLGNITIGKDAIIGANSVIVRSVPENAMVLPAPVKVLNNYSELSKKAHVNL